MYLFKALASVLLPAMMAEGAIAAAVTPLRMRDLEKFDAPSLNARVPTYLTPVPFPSRSRRRRNEGLCEEDYKLKIGGSWTWTLDNSSTPIARADCSFQVPSGEQPWSGRTVALERLMDSVAALQCTDDDISLQWKDAAAFQNAQSQWKWVNENEDRYIAMVVKDSSCAGGQRQVYQVDSYTVDEATLSMSMKADAVDFAVAFPYVHFKMSTAGVTPTNVPRSLLQKRADASIPLAQDFSGTEIFKENVSDTIDLSLVCGNCKTTGMLDLDFDATSDVTKLVNFESPVSASITLTPRDLSATLGLNIVASAKIAEGFTKSVTFLNIPLIENPLAVAGIANIGPSLMINMDATIGEVTAQVDLSLGAVTLAIPNDSKATLDVFGDDDETVGFQPEFTSEGPTINAGISATASLGPNIILGVDATILGTGAAAGLALAAPKLEAKAAIGTDQECEGVDFTSDLSAQLNAFAGVGKVAEVAAENTLSIVGTSTQLFSACLAISTDSPGAPAPPAVPAPADPLPTEPVGGVVGSAFNDIGCQMATNSESALAPQLCGKDGGISSFSSECPGVANSCCDVAMACGVATLNGVQGICCT